MVHSLSISGRRHKNCCTGRSSLSLAVGSFSQAPVHDGLDAERSCDRCCGLPGAAKVGVVAPGYRADLLLVADSPLEKPATLRTPLGVMTGGRWYDAAALKAMLADVAARRVVP